MSENNCYSGGFREAVCIDAGRVYDSCCARDCLEDLRVYFTPSGQETINNATGVHVRNAEILKTYIEVEPVSFNKGYYACDLTFYFLIDLDVYSPAPSAPTTVRGVASFTKRVILFGSEGNAKIFSNAVTRENDFDRQLNEKNNMPRVVVQAVDPVALDVKFCELKSCCEPQICFPECICNYMGHNLKCDCSDGTMAVYVTLGLFPFMISAFPQKSAAAPMTTSPAMFSETLNSPCLISSHPAPAMVKPQPPLPAKPVMKNKKTPIWVFF